MTGVCQVHVKPKPSTVHMTGATPQYGRAGINMRVRQPSPFPYAAQEL